MHTNNTNKEEKLIYPELSYTITGVCFEIHNKLGIYSREKQYRDAIAEKLGEINIPYKKEFNVKDTGNIIDFIIDDKIILEIKAKRFITKEDYYQIQRYLQILKIKLGLLINFHNRYLKPIRVIRIDTQAKTKFYN